jgi:hypothetical protein
MRVASWRDGESPTNAHRNFRPCHRLRRAGINTCSVPLMAYRRSALPLTSDSALSQSSKSRPSSFP